MAARRSSQKERFDPVYVTISDEGPLGLILEKAELQPVRIREIRKDGLADKNGLMHVGDIIVTVDTMDTSLVSVDVISKYMSVARPLRMVLKRKRDRERSRRIADEGSITASPRKPDDYEGLNTGDKVRNMFKEWRRLGPNFDFSEEAIEYIINFEFAPSSTPSPPQLIDSVLRTPKMKGRLKERYDPFTGKRLPESERHRFSSETGKSYEAALLFEQGQYAEYLSEDMCYRLAPIRRIVKRVDPEWEPDNENDEPEYEYFYSIGPCMELEPKGVRCSEEGVKLVYGYRAFVFQQWALLQVESKVRFCEDHDLDYAAMSFRNEAQELWQGWLDDERNKDFKELLNTVNERNPGATEKLVNFIMSPFILLDDISKKNDGWDLEGQVNLYTYVSIFGSGFGMAMTCALIQITSPALLLMAQLENDMGVARFGDGTNMTWEQFCTPLGDSKAQLMNTVVLLLYTVRVLPIVYNRLFSNWDGSGVSRMNAMRRKIFEQGDDTLWQKIGIKLNEYLNGGFVVFLYIMMLFILFLTDNIFDIILNALAMEFVAGLDEEISSAEYYDPEARFLQAGTAELVLRDVIDLGALSHWKSFCKQFNISREDYISAFEGRPLSLKSRKQGNMDERDPNYVSKEARYRNQAGRIATTVNNSLAVWAFVEPVVSFGIVDRILVAIGLKQTGVFQRYRDYYVWSRWEKVLFLSPVPRSPDERCSSKMLASNRKLAVHDGDGDQIEDDTSGYASGTKRRCYSMEASKSCVRSLIFGKHKKETFLNFYDDAEMSPLRKFLKNMIDILMFGEMYKSVYAAIRTRNLQEIPFRVIDGFIEWVNYTLQVTFPLTLIFFYYLVFACY